MSQDQDTKEFTNKDIWWLQKKVWISAFKFHFFEFLCIFTVYFLPVFAIILSIWLYCDVLALHSVQIDQFLNFLISAKLSFLTYLTESTHYGLIKKITVYTINTFTFIAFEILTLIVAFFLDHLLQHNFGKLDFERIDGQDLQHILKNANPHQVRFLQAVDQKTMMFKSKSLYELGTSELFFSEEFCKIFVPIEQTPVEIKLTEEEKLIRELKKKNLHELILIKEQEDLHKITPKQMKKAERKIL